MKTKKLSRETLKALREVGAIRPRILGWVVEPGNILAPIISASFEAWPRMRWYAILWDGMSISELRWQEEDPRLSRRHIKGDLWK